MLKFFTVLSILFTVNVFANDGPYIPTVMPSKEEVLRVKENDIVIGCDNAPNIIIEYSSLSCPHCAEYYKKVFSQVKSEIVNQCKAKYVYRDFPTTRSALKGVAVARCVAKNEDSKLANEKFFTIVQNLFHSQASWAFTQQYEENLSKILSIMGTSQEVITKCMNDKEILNDIISNSFIAMKAIQLTHSPSIFVNGKEVQPTTYDSIAAALK